LLGIEKCHEGNSVFSEAGLPSAEWGIIKLPPKLWVVIFRLLWFIGYARNSESRVQVRQRAVSAALLLEEAAERYQCVMFVGHGIFNRYLDKELRALGWSGTRSPATNYWGFRVYEKSNQ